MWQDFNEGCKYKKFYKKFLYYWPLQSDFFFSSFAIILTLGFGFSKKKKIK